MNLTEPIAIAVTPLLEALPIERAVKALVVEAGAPKSLIEIVECVIQDPAVAGRPLLQAGLWLYVDELDRSHSISQGITDATGSFWHGIMHRREGDFGNSHYWFNRMGHHPAMDTIEGYDAHAFIDSVESRQSGGIEDLIAIQKREWSALFEWCARP